MPVSRPVLRAAALAVSLITAGVLAQGVAHAAPPENDDFAAATVVSTLPFAVEQDTTEATAELDDPDLDCGDHQVTGSVWFRYTPAEDGLLRYTVQGSDRDLPVTVYTGEHGDLRRANPATGDCLRFRSGPATLRVTAGTTYHLMVSGGYGTRGGALKLAMERVTAPAHDNFADAQPITSLPFTGAQVDLAAASIEPDEPYTYGCHASPHAGSVWYSYTPSQTQFVLSEVYSQFSNDGPSLAVHEGTSLADLRQLSCTTVSRGKVVEMIAGRTYYLQYTHTPFYQGAQSVPKLSAAPELASTITGVAGNVLSTYDPVPLAVSFGYEMNAPVTSDWDFGDGTTVLGTQLRDQPHRYTADGTYTVTVRSKSADGRTATATRQVVIDTHNVEVTKLVVPASARVGETKPITLAVKSHHGAERPVIMLHRVYPNGAESRAGERWVNLPAQPAQSTFVQFHYTFTQEDLNLGTVRFSIRVQLPNHLTDARPDNNRKTAQTSVLAQSVQGAS